MDCPKCGRKLDGLMTVDPSKPGLLGLLRGEGEDALLNLVAWMFVFAAVFGLSVALFYLY